MGWEKFFSDEGTALPLGLALMRMGGRSDRPRNLGVELGTAFEQQAKMQQAKQQQMLQQMQMEKIKAAILKEKKMESLSEQLANLPQQYMKPAVPGAVDQGMLGPNLPIQSQQAQMLGEQMGQGGGLSDLIALNQSANFTQQGTPQEMPLQGQPASMDYNGLMRAAAPIQAQIDPQNYFKGIQGQAEQARKAQDWEQYIQGLPPEIKNNPAAMAVLSGGPELAGKLGPGVLPSVLKPKENKPLEGEQGRSKFKIFPDMTPEQAKAVGAQYIPGVGGIAKGEKDKPIQVNFGGGRGAGKAPSGYRFTADGNLEMIPGGPADVKTKTREEKEALLTDAVKQRADLVITKVDDALKNVGPLTTGLIGQARSTLLGRATGSSAFDLEKQIDTIKANIGFGELQAMRQASPTGGALGQVAVQELNMLQAVLGSLDKGQSQDELTKSLTAVKTHYQNWKNAVDKAQGASQSPDQPSLTTWSDANYEYRKLPSGEIQRRKKQ